jgi:hypothetical protein
MVLGGEGQPNPRHVTRYDALTLPYLCCTFETPMVLTLVMMMQLRLRWMMMMMMIEW